MKVYPEARVLLGVRDPETWYESARATIFRDRSFVEQLGMSLTSMVSRRARQIRSIRRMVAALTSREFDVKNRDKNYMLGTFEEHIVAVKRHVPGARLLVYQVKDGWEPLCRFLQVPAPDKPFPMSQ